METESIIIRYLWNKYPIISQFVIILFAKVIMADIQNNLPLQTYTKQLTYRHRAKH